MARIAGIDVGGTFTDLVLVDEATGEVRLAKVPTTPGNEGIWQDRLDKNDCSCPDDSCDRLDYG